MSQRLHTLHMHSNSTVCNTEGNSRWSLTTSPSLRDLHLASSVSYLKINQGFCGHWNLEWNSKHIWGSDVFHLGKEDYNVCKNIDCMGLFLKKSLYIYNFICFGYADLCCVGALSCHECGWSIVGMWASHCGGFFCCGAQALGWASVVVGMWAPWLGLPSSRAQAQ